MHNVQFYKPKNTPCPRVSPKQRVSRAPSTLPQPVIYSHALPSKPPVTAPGCRVTPSSEPIVPLVPSPYPSDHNASDTNEPIEHVLPSQHQNEDREPRHNGRLDGFETCIDSQNLEKDILISTPPLPMTQAEIHGEPTHHELKHGWISGPDPSFRTMDLQTTDYDGAYSPIHNLPDLETMFDQPLCNDSLFGQNMPSLDCNQTLQTNNNGRTSAASYKYSLAPEKMESPETNMPSSAAVSGTESGRKLRRSTRQTSRIAVIVPSRTQRSNNRADPAASDKCGDEDAGNDGDDPADSDYQEHGTSDPENEDCRMGYQRSHGDSNDSGLHGRKCCHACSSPQSRSRPDIPRNCQRPTRALCGNEKPSTKNWKSIVSGDLPFDSDDTCSELSDHCNQNVGFSPQHEYIPITGVLERSVLGPWESYTLQWSMKSGNGSSNHPIGPGVIQFPTGLSASISAPISVQNNRSPRPKTPRSQQRRRGRFTKDEDDLLIRLRNDCVPWRKIAHSFPGRSETTLRKRWLDKLRHDPRVQQRLTSASH